MDGRSRKATFKGYVTTHDGAVGLLNQAGDLAVVRRGVLRSAVIMCPDGCGELVTLNLDPRTGKAWRIYTSRSGFTLFPSVWRDTGCGSHFILWDDMIFWMDDFEPGDREVEELEQMEIKVYRSLRRNVFTPFVDLADYIGENPWAVLSACRQLVKTKRAFEGRGRHQYSFARR